MVTKKKRTGAATKKGRIKVGNLKLNRETIKDLSGSERKQIKGGGISVRAGCGSAEITCTCAKQ